MKENKKDNQTTVHRQAALFFGVAYPPNRFLQLNVQECKHSSRLTVKSAWL